MPYAPRYTNLVTMFLEATAKYGDKPLFGERKPNGWQWQTYTQFGRAVADARAGLHGLGVASGDRIAIISNNRLEWAICAYGTYTVGATYVPMYEAQLDKEWLYILRDSGAKACIVTSDGVEQRIRSLQADLPELQHVVNIEGDSYRRHVAAAKQKSSRATSAT